MFEDLIGKNVTYVLLEDGKLRQYRGMKVLKVCGNYIMFRQEQEGSNGIIINTSSSTFVKIIVPNS